MLFTYEGFLIVSSANSGIKVCVCVCICTHVHACEPVGSEGEIDPSSEETLKSHRFLYSGYSFNKHLSAQLASADC